MFWLKKNLPTSLYCQTKLKQLPHLAVKAAGYTILERPELFHARLLELIGKAQERITMNLLYLQDDPAGRPGGGLADGQYSEDRAHGLQSLERVVLRVGGGRAGGPDVRGFHAGQSVLL